jgi:predicted HD superfamily hydrolase involved in NAD metabolism
MKEKLKEKLNKARYEHAINTAKLAVELAERLDDKELVKSAEIAALLHDCAKEYSTNQMLHLIKNHNIELDEIERMERKLWHAPVGAFVAKTEYGVDDPRILRAIAIHSTAAPQMSTLDKIVYVADYIELSKNYSKAKEIGNVAKEDLTLATLMVLNHKLTTLLQKDSLIHPRSILTRNSLLLEYKRRTHLF